MKSALCGQCDIWFTSNRQVSRKVDKLSARPNLFTSDKILPVSVATKSPANKEFVWFWKVPALLSIYNNLLLYNDCIVILLALQATTLQHLHGGHWGMQGCQIQARASVWWPQISKQIEQMINKCHVCTKKVIYHNESIMSTLLPDYPWQVMGSNLFEVRGSQYLMYNTLIPQIKGIHRDTYAIYPILLPPGMQFNIHQRTSSFPVII